MLKTHFQKRKSVTSKMGHGHRNSSLIEVTGHCHTLSKKSLKVKQQLRKCLYELLSLCQSRFFFTNPYSLSRVGLYTYGSFWAVIVIVTVALVLAEHKLQRLEQDKDSIHCLIQSFSPADSTGTLEWLQEPVPLEPTGAKSCVQETILPLPKCVCLWMSGHRSISTSYATACAKITQNLPFPFFVHTFLLSFWESENVHQQGKSG